MRSRLEGRKWPRAAADLAARADVVFTSLPDDDALEAVAGELIAAAGRERF